MAAKKHVFSLPRVSRTTLLVGLGLVSGLIGACGGGDGDPGEGGEVQSVVVTYGETEVTVDLADLETVTLDDGEGYARLSDIVEEADLGVDLERLEFDFEGADGFRASSTPTCVDHIPMAGVLLRQGYVHRTGRDMAWEPALDMPGCTHVDDVARLVASDAGGLAPSIRVVHGETEVSVDLAGLEPVEVEGQDHVRLSDVIEAAHLGVALVALELDLEGADGFRPSDSGECADHVPVPGTTSSQGYVSLETHDLVWEEAADMPGCLGVTALVRILATDRQGTGPTVEVVYEGGDPIVVDLSWAEVVTYEAQDAVAVTAVIELALAGLSVDMASTQVDFEASDGFRPAMSAPCEGLIPLAGDDLHGGFLLLTGPDLVWDSSRGLSGCAYVDEVALIEVMDL